MQKYFFSLEIKNNLLIILIHLIHLIINSLCVDNKYNYL